MVVQTLRKQTHPSRWLGVQHINAQHNKQSHCTEETLHRNVISLV
jgi:hypothetical protein